MLQSLLIENYALIHAIEIRLEPGFAVITGETGAGKSILMGALSLILGNRADTDVLYDKTRKCIVEGTFNLTGLGMESFFEQNDLDYQNLTIIRREINEHGKSRAFVNDTPVNLNILRQLSSSLIDIHSQHQHLLLQQSGFRLGIVDQYAQTNSLLETYRKAYSALRVAVAEEKRLREQCTKAALEHEFRTFTIQEIENAGLQPDEQAEVEQAIRTLSHAEDIKTHLFQATQWLSEQEGENLLQQLKRIRQECSPLADISPEFRTLCDRLEATHLELQDIAYEISRKDNEVEVNPQELERLNERLDLIYTLEHKYQVDSIQELLEIRERLLAESETYNDNREHLTALEKQIQQLRTNAESLAEELSAKRKSVVETFRIEMEKQLAALGMPDARFEIILTSTGDLAPDGTDVAEFRFTANKGVEPADLSRVASGGEMSRVMLALKSIITDTRMLPTVIFDEIDTGISGETANRVGRVMSHLAMHHQVVAITHLAQIAARGNQHFQVYKETVGEQTITNIRELTEENRVGAIASMLSGDGHSEAALATARELLQSSSENQTKHTTL